MIRSNKSILLRIKHNEREDRKDDNTIASPLIKYRPLRAVAAIPLLTKNNGKKKNHESGTFGGRR
jgi:hypothetical protein